MATPFDERLSEFASLSSVDGADKGTKRDRFTHRTHTFDKLDVENVEKAAIKEMLSVVPPGESPEDHLSYTPTFFSRARVFFPDSFPVAKKLRKTNIYFIEDVGKFLWHKWNNIEDKDSDEAITARNNLLTYSYPLIDGVIFKYQRHKHMPYDEIFQSAIIKLLGAIPKFDPKRVVGTDEKGRDIYARIYTFLVLSLNFSITHVTMQWGKYKLRNISYDCLSEAVGGADGYTDAEVVYADFMSSLDSILHEDSDIPDFSSEDIEIYTTLRKLLNPTDLPRLSANFLYVMQCESGRKRSEISRAMSKLTEHMGPLKFSASAISYGSAIDDSLMREGTFT